MVYLYLERKTLPVSVKPEELCSEKRLLVELQELLEYVDRSLISNIAQFPDGSWSIAVLGVDRLLTKRLWVDWWLELHEISKAQGNPIQRKDLWFEDFFKLKTPQQAWADELNFRG